MLLELLEPTETLCLLLSDAAKHMVAGDAIQKSQYLKVFHVTCVVLQPLQWRCVDCMIHHEQDVREE